MFCSFPTERLSLNHLNIPNLSIFYSVSVYICNEAASFYQNSKKLQVMVGKKF